MISKKGSILILALWTLFFLSALAVAVGAYVDSGLRLAGWFKKQTIACYAARAGADRALMEVIADTNGWDGLTESWACNDEAFKNAKLGDGVFSITHTVKMPDSSTITNYGLIDEESRINVSKASAGLLASLMAVVGGADSASASQIAAAIIGWREKSDNVLTAGADNNYYGKLAEPIKCHNGAFQEIHELLLVKGVSSALFAKIEPYVTIYGTGKVNVNTAGAVVLRVLAVSSRADDSATGSLIDKIIRFRESNNVLKAATLADVIKQLELQSAEVNVLKSMMPMIDLRSTCFRGTSEGRSGDVQVSTPNAKVLSVEVCRIEFVFDRGNRMKVYWHED
jgi:general secretion pathway protein K